jgi:hypothetical protein
MHRSPEESGEVHGDGGQTEIVADLAFGTAKMTDQDDPRLAIDEVFDRR